jgi:outer membrane receptor for monomeric catechols
MHGDRSTRAVSARTSIFIDGIRDVGLIFRDVVKTEARGLPVHISFGSWDAGGTFQENAQWK